MRRHGAVTWYSNWTLSDVFNAIPIIIDHDTLMNASAAGTRVQHGLTTMYFSPAHLRAIVDEQPETLRPHPDLRLGKLEDWYPRLPKRCPKPT